MAKFVQDKVNKIAAHINRDEDLQDLVSMIAVRILEETSRSGIENGERVLMEEVATISGNRYPILRRRIAGDDRSIEFNSKLIDSIRDGTTRSGRSFRGGMEQAEGAKGAEGDDCAQQIPEAMWWTIGIGITALAVAFGPASYIFNTLGANLCGAAGVTLDAIIPGSMGCAALQTQFTTSMLLALTGGMWGAKKILDKSKLLSSLSDIDEMRSMIETKASAGLTRNRQGQGQCGKRNKSLKTKAKKSKKQKNPKNKKTKAKKNQRK